MRGPVPRFPIAFRNMATEAIPSVWRLAIWRSNSQTGRRRVSPGGEFRATELRFSIARDGVLFDRVLSTFRPGFANHACIDDLACRGSPGG